MPSAGPRLVRDALLALAAVTASASPVLPAAPPPDDARVEAAVAEARRVAGELTDTVRSLLQQELRTGGHAGALRVCAQAAPRLAREVAARTGRDVRRVSLKPRNPRDAPDAYERRRLLEFDEQRAARRLAVEAYEVVQEGGVETLRYMRPLVAAPLCLGCHGGPADIPAPVQAILKEKYPADLATGYQAGDVRGAVSVRVPLSAAPR